MTPRYLKADTAGRDRLGYALPGEHATQFRVQERLRGVAAACAERGLAAPIAL